MSSNSEEELLIDLARLLRKYGQNTFEQLAQRLSSPDAFRSIETVLRAVAPHAPQPMRQGTKPARRVNDVQGLLDELAISDPEKASLLRNFHNQVVTKQILPSLRDLESFASDIGIQLPRVASRSKAVGPLIKALVSLNATEFGPKLTDALLREADRDRSLEGWSDIILKRK